MMNLKSKTPILGIDVWMFVVIFAVYGFGLRGLPLAFAGLLALALSYLTADVFLSGKTKELAKGCLLTLAVLIYVFGLGTLQMMSRHNSAPYLFVHDGLIQIEESAKFLLEGKNPYVEDYTGTPLARWDFYIGELRFNPALYHNAYLPFLFLFHIPFYLVSEWLLGWYDGRMVFLPMFLVSLLILQRWVADPQRKFALLLFFSFNPFFTVFMVQGRNDVFILFWLILSVDLLRRGHERLSLISLGLACASKLTAWFLIPFFSLYLIQPRGTSLSKWLSAQAVPALRRLLPLFGTMALILVPFFLWQPEAFVDDVWNYVNGTATFAPYPISGYGFENLLRTAGLLPSNGATWLVSALQWVIGIPLLAVLCWRQVRNNSLPQMWFSYATFLGVWSFFSHVLNDNHIGFILTIFAISMLTRPSSSREPAREINRPAESAIYG